MQAADGGESQPCEAEGEPRASELALALDGAKPRPHTVPAGV